MQLTPWDLKPYQLKGVDFLRDTPRSYLIASMGAGKTVMTLSAIQDLIDDGEINSAIVFAPSKVASEVWPGEHEKWTHLDGLRVTPLIGDKKKRERAVDNNAGDTDVWICSIENVKWLEEQLKIGNFGVPDAWFIDEISKVSKPGGERTKVFNRISRSQRITHWHELTGTPIATSPLALYAPFKMIDGGARLGRTYQEYKNRFFTPRDRYGYRWDPRPGAINEIAEQIRDVTLTIDVADYESVDEPIVVPRSFALPAKARKAYDEMADNLIAGLTDDADLEDPDDPRVVEALNDDTKIAKLIQLTSGTVINNDGEPRALHDARFKQLDAILEEVDEPVVVGYWFKHTLERLRERYGRKLAVADAREPGAIDAWNRGELRLLFAQPASVGHGIELQHGGRVLVNFDAYWSNDLYRQLIERIGPLRQKRAGYERSVFVYNLVARDTVDEAVVRRRASKHRDEQKFKKALA